MNIDVPVIYENSESPHMAAIHVVPEFQTVPSGGRLEDITDQEGGASPFTHWAVHIHIMTWGKHS